MESKINIMSPFFENPLSLFYIREISKITNISHTAVRAHLKRLEKEGCLSIKESKPYNQYKANTGSKAYLNLKLYYNLEKIRKAKLTEYLEKYYEYPTIVVFGSFSKAFDDEKSDVDLCIISELQKYPSLKNFEKSINRPINIRLFSQKQWDECKKKNPDLINSICNGIVLSGQLEVL